MEKLEARTLAGARHAFFARHGGVSTGLYASLNCGYGSSDSREAVTENRARIAAGFGVGGDALITAYQAHTKDVVTVTAPWRPSDAPKADGLVTKTPGIVLGVLAADCAPVLFADRNAKIVGAAHAGWRGALSGIVEATVDAMVALGARRDRIAAAVGPCIGPDSYEVGPEFPAPFLAESPDNAKFFRAGPRKEHFDLPGYVLSRLKRAAIGEAEALRRDTCAEGDLFFSYRRSCLNKEPDFGRLLSAIAV